MIDFLMLFLVLAVLFNVVSYVVSTVAYWRAYRLMGYRHVWISLIPILRSYASCEAVRYTHARIVGLSIPVDIIKYAPFLYIFLNYICRDYPSLIGLFTVLAFLFNGWIFSSMLRILYGSSSRRWVVIGHLSALCPLVAYLFFLLADKSRVGWVV